jgi:hypothetical protein
MNLQEGAAHAAQEIRTNGWRQSGRPGPSRWSPGVCIYLAIPQGCNDTVEAVCAQVGVDPTPDALCDWNDLPTTTEADVLAALDAVAGS